MCFIISFYHTGLLLWKNAFPSLCDRKKICVKRSKGEREKTLNISTAFLKDLGRASNHILVFVSFIILSEKLLFSLTERECNQKCRIVTKARFSFSKLFSLSQCLFVSACFFLLLLSISMRWGMFHTWISCRYGHKSVCVRERLKTHFHFLSLENLFFLRPLRNMDDEAPWRCWKIPSSDFGSLLSFRFTLESNPNISEPFYVKPRRKL